MFYARSICDAGIWKGNFGCWSVEGVRGCDYLSGRLRVILTAGLHIAYLEDFIISSSTLGFAQVETQVETLKLSKNYEK